MTYLVTGAAGFIGFFTACRLLEAGHTVIGLDSVNNYYRTDLKERRLAIIEETARKQNSGHEKNWIFYRGGIEDKGLIDTVFSGHTFDRVIHLAAQAGVRYSIENPYAYSVSNLDGFLNILEACRASRIAHLAFASSSSVYGMNKKVPFSETDPVDHPVSLYAATKRANELMAHTYSHLYGISVTGMRFFTVYGPWGRPDMAYFKFADAIMQGKPIDIYNNGDLLRDFTYIEDIVKAVIIIADNPARADTAFDPLHPLADRSSAQFRLYNIGNNHPEKLETFIEILESLLGKQAKKKYLPMQAGDVYVTAADTSALERDFNWRPETSLERGLEQFIQWYKETEPWQKSL
ncbi:NAD-dependent epimerase [Brucepastera parasyntrophica]|uniref:NAD-dependent epimerase n=1 Tax=Brucepastera parasyntrophica TaxID=2880008 RepID=UPI00210BDB70|nr:NAD-dependent epimerase [Brucepastera parasyntrophica]ULQ60038.1 NAD-dependent epimerase [Brucepastera parasyntrophica]